MACQWTDEQTGGHCPTLASRFTGTDKKWFTFTNGVHTDSLDPATFNRWYDFLRALRSRSKTEPLDRRSRPPRRCSIRPSWASRGDAARRPDPGTSPTTPRRSRRSRACPPVRILFDNGAGGQPGQPVSGLRASPSRRSRPEARRRASWYLDGDGALSSKAPKAGEQDPFTCDLAARPPTDFTGNTGLRRPLDRRPVLPVERRTRPAPRRVRERPAGRRHHGARRRRAHAPGSSRKAPDVDLQVTVTEVRPDGKETFVQSGWVRARGPQARPREVDQARAGARACARATPRRCRRASFAKVTVPLYYQGHVYRAGSRIRVTISAAGGDQPIWAFGEAEPTSRHAEGRGRALARDAVEAAPPGGRRRAGADRRCRPARACAASRVATTSRTRTRASRSSSRRRARVPGGGPSTNCVVAM